ncbi:3-oxo-5-alpha-steroid 4-dehydrogenase 1-like isoform X1 [Oratosquilla oratoria]|uniref:3-oxo-5-alpha-steroid 4-dehydrogenase 1-like isoform X1 n=1 Tax=Oratosquilla oratoria TaxID=337810 RepID=UPI003F767210
MFIPELYIKDYVFPIFYATKQSELITRMSYGLFIYGVITILLPKAPYGRYSNSRYGFSIPARLAWFVQECPSFLVPAVLVVWGRKRTYQSITNQISLGMFLMHYFQRSFIYPCLMKSSSPTPFGPFLFAFLTCLYNGVLHGMYFVNYQAYDDKEWLWKPTFWIGVLIFLYGMKINIGSDTILRNLRKPGESGYKIPEGGMFKYVTSANYFGEMIEMWGYAVATQALPAIAHATFTSLFLSKRALEHHRWDEGANAAIEECKKLLSRGPVLIAPDYGKTFIIFCDASKVAVGAMLAQEKDGVMRPISFMSQVLKDYQTRYSTIEKEALALVLALKKFHVFLDREVVILSDHNPLKYIIEGKTKNDRLARWAIALQGYNLTVKYIPGKSNVVADALSRPDIKCSDPISQA